MAAAPPALRAILATPVAKRTEQQSRELAFFVLKEQVSAELAALPAPAMVFAAAPNFNADGSHKPSTTPRDVRMLKRGNIRTPGDKVEPGALSLLPKLPGDLSLKDGHTEGERRIGVLYLESESDEEVFTLKRPGLERFAYRIAHPFLIAVAFGAIEMAKTHLQCGLGGLLGPDMIWNQRAESDCGHRTGSVAELNP